MNRWMKGIVKGLGVGLILIGVWWFVSMVIISAFGGPNVDYSTASVIWLNVMWLWCIAELVVTAFWGVVSEVKR